MAADDSAPGDLELVREFVNTLDVEDQIDALDSPAALGAWLSDRALLPRRSHLSADDRRRALEFREALRAVLMANNGASLPRRALATLNDAGAAAPLAVRFGADGRAQLEPPASGIEAAIGRLASIAFQAMTEGTWARLKACPADDCHWAFYDRSRNRSGTWCDMTTCGNRAKARAFRERHGTGVGD
jgi:predicted RNA-binding Zn ribbon-like protein